MRLMDAKALEQELNDWMKEHETELFDLIRETVQEFESSHPGLDTIMVRINALSMADRRFMARAFAEVVSKYLK
jgi:hypothetical protein